MAASDARVAAEANKLLIRLQRGIIRTDAERIVKRVVGADVPELARALRTESFTRGNRAFLILDIPTPWAIFVHDDVRAIRARPGTFLVFWVNTRNDPRRRANQTVRRLTKREFTRILSDERERRGLGLPPRVVITTRVRARKGRKWFTEGEIARLGQTLGPKIADQFGRTLQGLVEFLTGEVAAGIRGARARR